MKYETGYESGCFYEFSHFKDFSVYSVGKLTLYKPEFPHPHLAVMPTHTDAFKYIRELSVNSVNK